jgi:hypothetical protein
MRRDRDFEANPCSKCDCRANLKGAPVLPRYIFGVRALGSRSLPPTISDKPLQPGCPFKGYRSAINKIFTVIG